MLEETVDLRLLRAAAARQFGIEDLALVEQADLVRVDAAAQRFAFPHPGVRSTVLELSADGAVRRAHLTLAAQLRDQPERRAWHLAEAAVGLEEQTLVRGDVYRLKRPRSAQGHEQQGERYAVVVQANAYEYLSTWLVAPTTNKSFGSMIHPTIELLGRDFRVLAEQTTVVDPQRLSDFAGRLDPAELMEINAALRAVPDLE